MIGGTIQTTACNRSQPWRVSDITLDDVDSLIDNNHDLINYRDVIGIKVKLASLQAELQNEKNRASKFQSRLTKANRENLALAVKNKLLRKASERESNLRETELRCLRDENKELRSFIAQKLSKRAHNYFMPVKESCCNFFDEDLSGDDIDNKPLKARGSFISKLTSSFRSSENGNHKPDSDDEHESTETTVDNVIESMSRVCRNLSSSFTTSINGLAAEMDQEMDASIRSASTDELRWGKSR